MKENRKDQADRADNLSGSVLIALPLSQIGKIMDCNFVFNPSVINIADGVVSNE